EDQNEIDLIGTGRPLHLLRFHPEAARSQIMPITEKSIGEKEVEIDLSIQIEDPPRPVPLDRRAGPLQGREVVVVRPEPVLLPLSDRLEEAFGLRQRAGLTAPGRTVIPQRIETKERRGILERLGGDGPVGKIFRGIDPELQPAFQSAQPRCFDPFLDRFRLPRPQKERQGKKETGPDRRREAQRRSDRLIWNRSPDPLAARALHPPPAPGKRSVLRAFLSAESDDRLRRFAGRLWSKRADLLPDILAVAAGTEDRGPPLLLGKIEGDNKNFFAIHTFIF